MIDTFYSRFSNIFFTLLLEFPEKSPFLAGLPVFGREIKLVQLQLFSHSLYRPKKHKYSNLNLRNI